MQLHPRRSDRGSMELLAFAALAIMITKALVVSAATIETTAKPPTKVDPPPHLFPDDETKYIIYYNNSSLLTSDGKGAPTASTKEIYEVLHAPQLKEQANKNGNSNLQSPPSVGGEPGLNKPQDAGWNPKLQIEMIQEPGATVEKDERKSDMMTQSNIKEQPGRWAALAAAIVLGVAVTIYVGLIFFRKRLERKYGSRHILVNEEENNRNF